MKRDKLDLVHRAEAAAHAAFEAAENAVAQVLERAGELEDFATLKMQALSDEIAREQDRVRRARQITADVTAAYKTLRSAE